MDITLISTADWDHPFWTNKQHVALSLVEAGHRLLYVDSVGLRPPRLEAADARRILRRLLRGLAPPRLVQPGLWVWSPMLWPAPNMPWLKRLNRGWFRFGLHLWQRLLGLRADLLWTYNPLTLQYEDPGHYRRSVYHCVDELKAQPAMPVQQLEAWEERLCRAVDLVFTTSTALQQSRSRWSRRCHLLGNVADIDHFAQARDQERPLPTDLEALPGPRAVFIGAISGYKLDLPLLAALVRRLPAWSFVLIGRIGEGDPGTDLAPLRDLPNLHLLGPRPYAELPSYLRGADAALLPCVRNPYTRAMFPMKFFEYLAAGVPVFSTPLPALEDYRSWACWADNAVGMSQQLSLLASGQKPEPVELALLQSAHSYRARTAAMLRLLEEVPQRQRS